MNACASTANVEHNPAKVAMPPVRRTFVLNVKQGLHARPCAMLVKTLQPYRLSVEVEAHGEKASGTSILGLMSLAAGFGSRITFTIVGNQAPEAMELVDALFKSNFETGFKA